MGQQNMYAGDVYILEDSVIVGGMEKIMFRQWPRVMLQRFFMLRRRSRPVQARQKVLGPTAASPRPPAPLGKKALHHLVRELRRPSQQRLSLSPPNPNPRALHLGKT
jgi:hypothetical protein